MSIRSRSNFFFLQSRCPASIEGYTDWCDGFMKYAIQIALIVTTYVASLIKIRSGIQKVIKEDGEYTDSMVIA
jgi:hypothetical protein